MAAGGAGGAGGEVVLTPPLPLLSPFTALVVNIYIIKNVVIIVIMINVMLEILSIMFIKIFVENMKEKHKDYECYLKYKYNLNV